MMFSWMIEVLLNLAFVKLVFGAFIAFVVSSKFFKMILKECKPTRTFKHPSLAECAIQNWHPKPLIDESLLSDDSDDLRINLITSSAGKYVEVNGIRCLNFVTHNYLGFLTNEAITKDAIKAISKYGVGSCGPRGFYGTIDVHLELEENLAKFMRTQNAVIYSYGFSTIASAIPAYSKKNDVIFADEKVNFAIQRGIEASRSTVYYFNHNDPKDLERILETHFTHVRKVCLI